MKSNMSILLLAVGWALSLPTVLQQADPTLSDRGAITQRVSIALSDLVADLNGGVVAVGTIWAAEGFLLRDDGEKIRVISVPNVKVIESITFISRQVGWMIADGKPYRTKDGGSNWSQTFVDGQKHFTCIHFNDLSHGWLVGEDSTIYHTDDAGVIWLKQDSKTKADFKLMLSVDSLKVWALGKQALITTDNGGQTWKGIEPFYAVSVITFIDKRRGWGLDLNGNILRTIDGGGNWEVNRSSEGEGFRSIFFINERDGWVVGKKVLHTSDGGETWSSLTENDVDRGLGKTIFTDGKRGWAIGNDKSLFRTNDGGRTWTKAPEKWQEEISERVYRSKIEKKSH